MWITKERLRAGGTLSKGADKDGSFAFDPHLQGQDGKRPRLQRIVGCEQKNQPVGLAETEPALVDDINTIAVAGRGAVRRAAGQRPRCDIVENQTGLSGREWQAI